jgi:hypothetical protein
MSVFKKQGVYWIDYYVNGHRKRERIDPDGWPPEAVVGMLQGRNYRMSAIEKTMDRSNP